MQLFVLKTKFPDPEQNLRRAGYAVMLDRSRSAKSYVRRFHHELYPRFHVYIEDKKDQWAINLHLDQRAPVYAGVTAHSGEYDGVVVEREIERIKTFFQTGPDSSADSGTPEYA